jgi:hypothetical protein
MWSAQRIPTAVFSLSRPEPLFLPSSSSIVLARLSEPRSGPTTSQEILVAPGIEPGPLDLQPGTLTTRPQRRSVWLHTYRKCQFCISYRSEAVSQNTSFIERPRYYPDILLQGKRRNMKNLSGYPVIKLRTEITTSQYKVGVLFTWSLHLIFVIKHSHLNGNLLQIQFATSNGWQTWKCVGSLCQSLINNVWSRDYKFSDISDVKSDLQNE